MASRKYILAFDQGTTSSRSIVFDHNGAVVATAQQEFEQIYPRPGWVEHDPMAIWSSQNATAADALAKANLTRGEIAAVGLTNQRETTIVWEKASGRPVYNAIVWQDGRTADYCRQLRGEGLEEMVSQRTGLRIDPYFAGTKLRWMLENVSGVRKKAENGELLFGTVDSWLLWQLTGGKVHATDITNASRTLLYNIEKDDWDDELLQLFGIPRCLLPEIRSCSEVYGEVERNLHPAGTPIAGIAGDQHAALFGQACFKPGMAKNTYGTGCFLLMQMGERPTRSDNNLLTTVAWRIGKKTEYALEGSIFAGGAIIQWLRDELEMVRDVRELNRLAESVPDSDGLFLVPAFAGLGAPHWDPYARGSAFGMTRGTNRAHFCRAALESIGFQSADLITCMRKDSGISLKELRVDGGVANSDALMQFQADLLQECVLRPACTETTAMGAAYLAGIAVGFWDSPEAVSRNWQCEQRFEPKRSADKMQALRAGWDKAVARSKGWAEQE